MYPLQHLLLGGLFALGIFLAVPQVGLAGFLIIVVSTVLIDFDHYLVYVYKEKDLSPRKAYNWYLKNDKPFMKLSREQRNKLPSYLFIFHGIEVLIFLTLLSIFFPMLIFVITGFTFHLLLDSIHQVEFIHDRVDKLSLINDFLKFRIAQN